MLTSEQLKAIEDKAVKAFKCRCEYEYCDSCSTTWHSVEDAAKDIIALTNHIAELHQKAFCEHHWVYYFNEGFQCSKCQKHKEKK